jgi:hypothetical protein
MGTVKGLKKLHPHQQLDVDTAVGVIVSNPFVGEAVLWTDSSPLATVFSLP